MSKLESLLARLSISSVLVRGWLSKLSQRGRNSSIHCGDHLLIGRMDGFLLWGNLLGGFSSLRFRDMGLWSELRVSCAWIWHSTALLEMDCESRM